MGSEVECLGVQGFEVWGFKFPAFWVEGFEAFRFWGLGFGFRVV